jgi:CDP-6-deoxy-D-xylo-4-hexulose-3-dehydrase
MAHPLMNEAVSADDFSELIEFLKTKPKVTAGEKVREFEASWSEWLGVKYSVFVNSGSSANILTWKALKSRAGNKTEVIIPPLTWVSDVAALIYAGFTPIFVDINMKNLALDDKLIEKYISDKTYGLFLTHILGLNGLTNKLLNLCDKYNVQLIEDCCESHGASFANKKVGTFGLVSNFSFYFAHHLTTIEGGMISTNDKEIYHQLKRLRGHGMLRESGDDQYNDTVQNNNSDLHPEFIFPELGYNFRSNELSAVIGLNQLKRIDSSIEERKSNFEYLVSKLNDSYFKDFTIEGQSSYAFIIILKEQDKVLFKHITNLLDENNIEYRRGLSGGGNQLRQPYIKNDYKWIAEDFSVIEHIHQFSFYIGNYPGICKEQLDKIIKVLNN